MSKYFPELGEVNIKSLKFIKMFITEWVRYFPFFWLNCPVKRYWDYFGSSYRVSLDCTKAKLALENETDIWSRNSLRSKFLHCFD